MWFSEVELLLRFSYNSYHKKTQSVMVDVGAHVGTSCLPFAKRGWRVVAFEPEPENYLELYRNLSTYRNVTIFNKAISNEDRSNVTFYVSSKHWGIHSLKPFHESHKPSLTVETIRLDTILNQLNVFNVSLLKIDIEGADFLALQSFNFNQIKPDIVMCEFADSRSKENYGYSHHDMASYMQERGYYVFVSEWAQVQEYGRKGEATKPHRFIQCDRYPLYKEPEWGNLIFVESNRVRDFEQLLSYYLKEKQLLNIVEKKRQTKINMVHSDILIQEMQRLEKEGSFESLRNHLRKLTKAHPYYFPALTKLIDLSLSSGNLEEARNVINIANQVFPTSELVRERKRILTYRENILNESHEKIRKFKNKHKGERCVILGNGPSLNKMDLSFLKDEFCFATNRIYLGFEKWDFVPTYYVSVNSLVIAQSAQEIQQIPCPKFISVVGIPNLQPQEDLIFINTVTCKDAFSETPENGFNIGATVTYVAMQLAYYMGFETVILIGVDHYFETKGTPHKAVVSQGEDPNHFHPSYFGKGVRWQLPDLPASEKMYQIAEQHYQQNNRQIIDATVDGHCPIFPKQNYQELFYNNREQFPIESNERELAPSFLNRLYRDIYFYQKHPNETTVISRLRQKRWELAQKWLNLQPSELENAYQGDLGRANKVFLNSGVLLEARTDEENSFVKNISAQIQETIDGESVIQFFLATCTYGYAYQLNLLIDVEHIPQWLLADYIKLVFVSPLFATEKGDIASYKEYIKYSIDKIYRYIKDYEEIKGQKWQTILDAFVSVFHVKHLLASPDDLKEITDKRAELIQIYIEQQCNSSLECDVLSIPEERQKNRVGILARSFAPNKEIFTSLPIYRHLNRDDFEIVLLKPQKTYHRIEKYCEGNADRSILLSGSIATQAEIVRQLDIDILWIAGDIVTGNADELSLLAAHRLARIQFVDANSPVTTGLPYIDYSILSSWVGSKQEFQPHYTEHLLPLDAPPHCIDLATEEKAKPSISITRDALGIQEDCIVYIAEVDYYTLIPELVETWAKIVARVPKSILLLYPVPTELPPYISTDNIHHTISGSFQKYCNESERLIFLDAVSSRADLQEYLKLGDIYLDSYVQSDIYSLTSPLQVGLPTVVYEGNTPRSRQSSSLLKSLQMEELVASNKEDYIQLAVSLGTNEAVRREKSNHITQRMREHPLVFDTRAYSDCIESVFHEVFHSYLAKELKQSFNLRNNNLIVFPDWNQPEDWLYEHLGNIIDQLARRTDKETTTLLIEASDISEEDANLIISGIAMNLLMEEELDVEAGPDISIVTKLGKLYWQALRSQLQARILLEHENQEAIAEASADLLPICTIDSLNEN